MSIAGIWSDSNLNADSFTGTDPAHTAMRELRRENAQEITRGGEKFYKYNIVTVLNHGLARQDKPLPSGIPIQITFNRAKSEKAVLQVSNKLHDGSDFVMSSVVALMNPVLRCYFTESKKSDAFYGKTKLYDVQLPFMDYSLRRELLLDNISEFNLKLFEGKIE